MLGYPENSGDKYHIHSRNGRINESFIKLTSSHLQPRKYLVFEKYLKILLNDSQHQQTRKKKSAIMMEILPV